MGFLGSMYDGFGRLGRIYEQSTAMSKFQMHFYHKFERNARTINKNGDVIDLPTKLYVREMSKYGSKYEKPAPYLPLSETIQSFQLPYITEQILITPDMLTQRIAREPYESPDREVVSATKLVSEEYARLVDRINRRKELSAIQALVDGEISDDEGNKVISFPKVSTHITTPTNQWNNIAQANPIADIDNLCYLLHADGGTKEFELYMGASSFNYFAENPKVKDSVEFFDRGILQPTLALMDKSEYMNVWAMFTTPRGNRITIKQYTELYDTFDTKGLRTGSKYFFPEKKVLIIAKGAPLQLGIGRPNVMRPNARSNYDYREIDDTIVTMKTEEDGLYMTVRHCGCPLIPYMNRLGTINAVA